MTMTATEAIRPPARELVEYLGPARVTRCLMPCIEVRLPGGQLRLANMALAYPYRPVDGDVLLIAAKGVDTYVIGVIQGHGATNLQFQGDVQLHAIGGKVEIMGDDGVVLRSNDVQIIAGKLKVAADAVSETFTTCFRRVHELLTVKAGESRMSVSGFWYAQADRAQINVDKTIGINGREVHLG